MSRGWKVWQWAESEKKRQKKAFLLEKFSDDHIAIFPCKIKLILTSYWISDYV